MALVILFTSLLLTFKAEAQSCPYITEKSALTSLQEQASDLELKVYEKKSTAACQRRLDELKSRISKVDQLESKINTAVSLTKESTSQVDSAELSETLKASSAAANSLSGLLSGNCDLSNSNSEILSIADRLASTLEAGATILAWKDPASAVIGAVTAIGARLLVTVGHWFNSRNQNLDIAESNLDDRRYLDSLCFFRNLTQRYDQLRSSTQNTTQLREFIVNKQRELEQLSCEEIAPTADTNLNELLSFAGKLQEHLKENNNFEAMCASAVDQLSDARLEVSLRPLMLKADCQNQPKSYQVRLFCEKHRQLNEFSQSPNCEDEEKARAFLKNAQTYAELLPKVRKVLKPDEPKELADRRARVKDELADLQLQLRLYDQMSNEPATMRQLTARSMENLGIGLLGKKFESYAERSLDRADDANDAAADEISELQRLMKRNQSDKSQICRYITSAQYKITSAKDATQSVNLICQTLANGGNPPLKSSDMSYDSLSMDTSGNNVTRRCNKLSQQLAKEAARSQEYSGQLTRIRSEVSCQ